MKPIARYDNDSELFAFNLEKLSEAGIELNVLNCKGEFSVLCEMTMDALVFNALDNYFKKEKVISFNALDCYKGSLLKSSRILDKMRQKNYPIPIPLNPRGFTQEDILELHRQNKSSHLLSMIAFAEKEYERRFLKRKNK